MMLLNNKMLARDPICPPEDFPGIPYESTEYDITVDLSSIGDPNCFGCSLTCSYFKRFIPPTPPVGGDYLDVQLDLITNATSGPCYDCYRTNSEAIIELIHQKILEYWASYYGLEGRTTQHHHLITRAGCYHYPTGGGAYPLECFFDITACCYKNFNITMDNYGNITSYTADGMGAYAYPPGYEATCTSEHDPGYNSCFILCGIVAGLNLFVTHPKQSVASDEFNIQAKSTDNSSDNYSINVYNGHLVIKSNCSNQQDVNITMTDYLGNVVFNTASNYKPNSEKSFKLPFLYNGIYLINLNNTNYSTSKKISILN